MLYGLLLGYPKNNMATTPSNCYVKVFLSKVNQVE